LTNRECLKVFWFEYPRKRPDGRLRTDDVFAPDDSVVFVSAMSTRVFVLATEGCIGKEGRDIYTTQFPPMNGVSGPVVFRNSQSRWRRQAVRVLRPLSVNTNQLLLQTVFEAPDATVLGGSPIVLDIPPTFDTNIV